MATPAPEVLPTAAILKPPVQFLDLKDQQPITPQPQHPAGHSSTPQSQSSEQTADSTSLLASISKLSLSPYTPGSSIHLMHIERTLPGAEQKYIEAQTNPTPMPVISTWSA